MAEPIGLYCRGRWTPTPAWQAEQDAAWAQMLREWEDEIWAEYEAQRRGVVLDWPTDRLTGLGY